MFDRSRVFAGSVELSSVEVEGGNATSQSRYANRLVANKAF
jgi:hypothetical protein